MKLKIEYRSVASLHEYAGNARTHSDAQVAQLVEAIREFGFTNPILIDKDGQIIAGHGRLLAAKSAGMEQVPTVCLGHLSERQKRAYVLADNKIALNAGWDFEKLADEIGLLAEEDFDLSLTGFDEHELDAMLKDDLSILPDQSQAVVVHEHLRTVGGGSPEDGFADSRMSPNANVPADVAFSLGEFRFIVDRRTYLDWLESLRQSAGFTADEIISELKTRLDL